MSKIFKESGFLDKPAVIREKVLPLNSFRLFTDMEKQELVPEKMAKFVEEAEKYLDEEIPFMTLYEHREFKITGDRSHYQKKSHKRRNMLFALSLAEHYEGKGRFTSKLCDVVWAILEETSWIVPAHATHNQTNPTADVPCVYDEETMHGIDLYTGVTAGLLATVLIYNREAIDSVSPIIAEKIIYEIKKKFIIPYLSHHPKWSGEYGGKVNNWCPWIVSNVLFVTAVLEDNDYDRASVVLRAMKHLDNYTNCIPDDGGCDEGPGYWGAAGAALFDCCEILYDMTDGYIDVFSHPHLRAIGEYEVKMNINEDRFVNYGDAGSRFYPNGFHLTRFGKRTGSQMMEAYGRMVTRKTPDAYPANSRMYRALKDILMEADREAKTTLAPKQVWLPDLKIFITRESEDTSKGMFIALKGGCNGESHNHNDVGHFIIYYNGNPVIIDPGTVQYTRDTFGKNRYTIWAMQSHYHNLPAFDGYGEKNGKDYKATREVYDEAAGTASLGLEEAYEKDAGVISFTRTAGLDGSEAVIKDDIVLDREREIDFRLMTHVEPKLIEEGKVALAEDRVLVYDRSLACEIETFDPVKADTNKHWGTPVLYRIHLSCRAKEFHGEMRFI